MHPWSLAFKFWKDAEPEVSFKLFIFNYTNTEEFLAGVDDKIKLKELDPIVYEELLIHTDVTLNENSTLSYTATKKVRFLEHRNEPGALNQTIVIPNLATMVSFNRVDVNVKIINIFQALATYLKGAFDNFLIDMGANALMLNAHEKPFKTITPYDFFWNYKSDVLTWAKTLGGTTLVPTENMGMLANVSDINFSPVQQFSYIVDLR